MKIVHKIKNNSKTKNQKIYFSFVSEHHASFWTKKKVSFWERGRGGVRMPLTWKNSVSEDSKEMKKKIRWKKGKWEKKFYKYFFYTFFLKLMKKNVIWIGAKNIFCSDFDDNFSGYFSDDSKRIRKKIVVKNNVERKKLWRKSLKNCLHSEFVFCLPPKPPGSWKASPPTLPSPATGAFELKATSQLIIGYHCLVVSMSESGSKKS